MPTLVPNFFSINGVISTERTVMQNITALCDATGVFLTYDVNAGAWSVIINAPTTSSKTFDDSNIIGNIDVSGSGINEMYNSVSFEFPHKDLRDETDYVEMKIPDEDRFPMELDNELTMSTDLVNDSAVAQYLAAVELKQSRMDKVITFSTDYTSIGLKAGDVITVNNDAYGFNNKQFRITRMQEDEQDSLVINITALEYGPSIYSTDGLERTYRSKKTGIIPKALNGVLNASDNEALSAKGCMLTVDIFYTGEFPGPGMYLPAHPSSPMTDTFLNHSFVLPYTGTYKTTYNINWGGNGQPDYTNQYSDFYCGVQKMSALDVRVNGANVVYEGTGDSNSQLYEDHYLEAYWLGTAGDVVEMWFGYQTNWTQANVYIHGMTQLLQIVNRDDLID